MLSRIFWVGLAVLALVAGMLLQNGDEMLAWTGYHDMSGSTERSVERRLDRALDRSFDRMEVHGADGGEIDVPAETKRAMANIAYRLFAPPPNACTCRQAGTLHAAGMCAPATGLLD